jgi:multiple sugar transport system ATP-binding protein
MEHLLDRRPSQLSGGQRQRVAIGRAIVRDPEVFLFDEPLSNLDAALRMDMRMEIGKLHQDLGATMVYVTHDQVEAMTLADKIVVLKDGKVMQTGSPMELYHHPANLFVAGFLGSPSMNFIKVETREVAGSQATVASAALDPIGVGTAGRPIRAGGPAILGVRPQYLSPSETPAAGMLHGTVRLTERLGAETVVEVSLKDGTSIIAALGEDRVLEPGSEIGLRFDPAQAHLFAAT